MVMTTMVPAFADTMTLNNSKSGITWMQVRNGAQTMWVGIDYSNADVGVGSTFHADWITADDATYHDVFNNIDDNIKSTLTDNHCVLRVGITDRDGKEITTLKNNANIFVQLGAAIELESVKAWFVSDKADENALTQIHCGLRTPDGETINACGLAVNHFGDLLIDSTVDAVKAQAQADKQAQEDAQSAAEKLSNYRIKIKEHTEHYYIKPGEEDFYFMFADNFSIIEKKTGRVLEYNQKYDLTKQMYYVWTDEAGVVLHEGIDDSAHSTDIMTDDTFGKKITCSVYSCNNGELYGKVYFITKNANIQRNGFAFNGESIEEKPQEINFVAGQKRTINVENYYNIDELELCKLDKATGEYVPCYTSIAKKHISYKWVIINGKIDGSRHCKKVTALINSKTKLKCKVYLYGRYVWTIEFKPEKLAPVGFKGYKYEPYKYIAADKSISLKLVPWKKGILPKTAVFRYTKNYYDEDLNSVTLTGRKTKSPYASASLKGIASLKGGATYTCEVFRTCKSKKPMYTVYFYAIDKDNDEQIHVGDTVEVRTDEGDETAYFFRNFIPQTTGNYILSYDKENVDSYVVLTSSEDGIGRPAYDGSGDYVFHGTAGVELNISAFVEANNLKMTLTKCTHEKRAAVECHIVCTKCGKILK